MFTTQDGEIGLVTLPMVGNPETMRLLAIKRHSTHGRDSERYRLLTAAIWNRDGVPRKVLLT